MHAPQNHYPKENKRTKLITGSSEVNHKSCLSGSNKRSCCHCAYSGFTARLCLLLRLLLLWLLWLGRVIWGINGMRSTFGNHRDSASLWPVSLSINMNRATHSIKTKGMIGKILANGKMDRISESAPQCRMIAKTIHAPNRGRCRSPHVPNARGPNTSTVNSAI